ncbi:MAG: hypothetical protein HY867_05695 [Chloroflexi bacterium]|nr:hypothetical protein [Chloroflexota bacterium]
MDRLATSVKRNAKKEKEMSNLKKPIFWAPVTNFVYWFIFFLVITISIPFSDKQKMFIYLLDAVFFIMCVAYVIIAFYRHPIDKSGISASMWLAVSTIYILLGGFLLFVLLNSLDFLYSESPLRLLPVVGAGMLPCGIVIFVLSLLSLMSNRKSKQLAGKQDMKSL